MMARTWLVLALLAGGGGLIYLLAPVLTPFIAAALLAYLGDPVADWLEDRRLSRTLAVVLVFSGIFIGLTLVALVLIPLLEGQIRGLLERLPGYLSAVQQTLLPKLADLLGMEPAQLLDVEALRQTLSQHWRQAGGLLAGVLGTVSRSGLAVLGWLVNLVLIPVVTFYLLRDWDRLMEHLRALMPRRMEATLVDLAKQADEVLGAFLRGQFLVMLALGVVYSTGLWLLGLELSLLLGMLAGMVSFVPYLGFIVGIIAAGVAAYMQFHDWLPLLWVAAVFGVGQALESIWLTPRLVGDRIGLHPVAVIFSVMAGGQLFGFLGVLLALPVASVVMVLVRHLHRRYLNSSLYDAGS